MSENILRMIKPADIITLISALLGFSSIILTGSGQYESALILILIAVIADGADGAVARYSGSGVLGENLDSLADVISFGVAPAIAAFAFLENSGIDELVFPGLIFPGLFLVCGILRLARFNVTGKKDGFEGIPITAGGFIVALFLLAKNIIPDVEYVFVLLLLVLSFLMVSTISYPKIKSPVMLAPAGILLVMAIAGSYREVSSLLLLVIVFVYILSPVTGRFYDRSK